ncbi:hypothetical protein HY389_00205 [Candidatus Daviesbacteria bacterium]|nr:hypothetical protein [Candidatus Daviesbacteria bacterium]
MISEKQPLSPSREYTTRWFRYEADQTGLPMIFLEDQYTGVIVGSAFADPEKRIAATKAWGGARQSRAPGTPWEIYHEMGERGIDPDVKLEDTFENYGHKSVGDMARIQIEHQGMPMHLAFTMFHEGYTVSGQEKSTRYQSSFKSAVLHPLQNYVKGRVPPPVEEFYQGLGRLALDLFAKQRELLTPAFEEYYQPPASKKGSLNSRVLDCARYFLLFGQSTGCSYETSARDWSRLISGLRASHIPFYRTYGSQLEEFLAPPKHIEEALGFKAEAPSLVRHSEADQTVNKNLAELKQFLVSETDLLDKVPIKSGFPEISEQRVDLVPRSVTSGQKVVMQYLMTLWPGLDRNKMTGWVAKQPQEVADKFSSIIFNGHNKFKEPPSIMAVNDMTLAVHSDLGLQRDFNRQRAWGRFMPLPLLYGEPWDKAKAEQVLGQGFGMPLYLSEVDKFKDQADNFAGDLKRYYEKLFEFLWVAGSLGTEVDYSFMVNVLPLAHTVDLYMHGNPKQALYFTDLRYRPGGHINYRVLAFDANQQIADSDPYLSGMRLDGKPDPASKAEFADRS